MSFKHIKDFVYEDLSCFEKLPKNNSYVYLINKDFDFTKVGFDLCKRYEKFGDPTYYNYLVDMICGYSRTCSVIFLELEV